MHCGLLNVSCDAAILQVVHNDNIYHLTMHLTYFVFVIEKYLGVGQMEE